MATARKPTARPRVATAKRIDTAREALALLAAAGAMTLVSTGERRSLVEAIAGAPVAGSWWSHPRGKAIFQIATELEDSGDVLVGKLVQGKVTFVHRALWPALYRVVTDPRGRARRREGLTPAGRALLARVERTGRVRCAASDRAARQALEATALVHAASEHTESGRHAAVLTAWSTWVAPDVAAAARAIPLATARAQLAAAGIEL